jgi:hypothetical protein
MTRLSATLVIALTAARARPGAADGAGGPLGAVPRHAGAARRVGRDAAGALKVQWTYEAGDAIESSAAIADGVVYVGSASGELHAVGLADGKLRWKYKAR